MSGAFGDLVPALDRHTEAEARERVDSCGPRWPSCGSTPPRRPGSTNSSPKQRPTSPVRCSASVTTTMNPPPGSASSSTVTTPTPRCCGPPTRPAGQGVPGRHLPTIRPNMRNRQEAREPNPGWLVRSPYPATRTQPAVPRVGARGIERLVPSRNSLARQQRRAGQRGDGRLRIGVSLHRAYPRGHAVGLRPRAALRAAPAPTMPCE